MMSISAIKSAGRAASYYSNKDNYYVLGNLESRWEGKGADELGLSGMVDNDQLTKILQGQLPDGSSLSRKVDGQETHRPGYDLTFSTPKSVSMMALIGGDRRLIEAHNAAVSVVLQEIEGLASARITVDKVTSSQLTGNLIAAIFNHDTSRDLDPQLHSHVLIMNATKTENGWRALSSDTKAKTGFSEAVMANQVVLGNLYRRALRPMVESMGYETQESGKNGLWEMKDMPTELFSQRSQAIDAAVGEGASAKCRDIAALDTRKAKMMSDPAQLLAEWQKRLMKKGFDMDAYLQRANKRQLRHEVEQLLQKQGDNTLVKESEDRCISHQTDKEQNSVKADDQKKDQASDAVTRAISILSENTVRFTYSDLLAKSAAQLPAIPGMFAAVRNSIDIAIEHQRLIPLDKEKGIFTSDIHLLNELSITVMTRELMRTGRAMRIEARSRPHQGPWSDAVAVMRQDRPMVAVMEGQGGAAVLRDRIAEVVDMARDMGREVNVLAPDNKSQQWLSGDKRIDKLVLSRAQFNEGARLQLHSTLIIDQAEKLSLKETLMLVDEAHKQSAQLIFMDTGKRQGTGNALDVLKSSDASLYRFSAEKQTKVSLISEPDKRIRYSKLAAEFVSREAAGEIVVAQVKGVREQKALTACIRSVLADHGKLGEDKTVQVLSPVYLTNKTRRLRENYREGMVLEQWNSAEKSMSRWFVKRVGEMTNTLTLEGAECEVKTVKISQLDASWSLYRAEMIPVAEGDRLNVTAREAKGQLKAGDQVRVASVTESGITVLIRDKYVALETDRGLKLSYGYVESLGSSVKDRAHVLTSVARSDMSRQTLSQLSRSGERISLYTGLDEMRAQTLLKSNSMWRLASQHVKTNAGETDLEKAMHRQKDALYTDVELAVKSGANVAQAKHASGIVFSSVQLLHESSVSGGNIPLSKLKSEITRQVRAGELINFETIRDTGLNMMVQRASYELERSIVRHIVEGKGNVEPLMRDIPNALLNGLTPGQQEASKLILQSDDRFIAIQGYAGVGKTTQLKAVMSALTTLPATQQPEVIGLAPTHRAVLEMQSVGINAQTLASFLAEEKQKSNNGEVHRYAGKLFLVDESSMVGNRDMADVYQLIANGGGRGVLSGDVAQLKSPESGVPFAMQQSRSPIDVAVMKDIVRQTPELKEVVYSIIEGNHHAALTQAGNILPDLVPRKDGAWIPESSVVEIRKKPKGQENEHSHMPITEKTSPDDVTDAIAMDYAGRTVSAQRDSIVITQTNDDRNAINAKIHALRHHAGETGREEFGLSVLTRVNTQRDELRNPAEWCRHTGKYAFLDNRFWTVRGVDVSTGVARLVGEDGEGLLLSVRENSSRDVSIWETNEITVSKGDRLRFSATDNERGYVANSIWDIVSVDEKGRLTLMEGECTRVIDPMADKYDSRIDLAYAVTTHGSQGASEQYSISLQGVAGKRGRLVSQDNSYVQLSRAKVHGQVYTDDRHEWLKRMTQRSGRLSAHDLMEADSDRHRQTGIRLFGRAVPAAATGIGRKLLSEAGIKGEFKGRFVNSSAKYPVPHMALPLYDTNGRDAGVLLTEIRRDDGWFSFNECARHIGAKDGRFAGFQQSLDGNVIVVTSYNEAIEAAKKNPEVGILMRTEGEGVPWNLHRLLNGKVTDSAAANAIDVVAEHKEDPIPFIMSDKECLKDEVLKKAIELAALRKGSDKTQAAVSHVAGEIFTPSIEKGLLLSVPDRDKDNYHDAVAEVARKNLVQERIQQIERDMVRDKTLGE